MLSTLLRNKVTITVVTLFVGLLAAIRFFEQSLFYDPFLNFFKGEFQNENLPDYDAIQLFLGLLLRYLLNTSLSLAIIYAVFRELPLLKFAALLYGILFVLLITGILFMLLHFSDHPDYMLLFYLRRFLIAAVVFGVVSSPRFIIRRKTSKKF